MKIKGVKTASLLLAVIAVICVFSVSAFAANQKEYGGKFGTVKTVKKDLKTECTAYSASGDTVKVYLYFKTADGVSDSQRERTFYGFAIYSDSEFRNILVNKSGYFPRTDSTATVPVNFSTLGSGTYYGIVYTWIKDSKGTVIVDKDTIVQFKLSINKLGNSTPALNSVTYSEKGSRISWDPVEYADRYKIMRREAGTEKWTVIKETDALFCFDDSAAHGVKYYYTVQAFDGKYGSKYDTAGVQAVFLDAPRIGCELSDDNVIKISWNKVKGATGYYIYRKTAGAKSYVRFGKVSSKYNSFLDKSEKKDGETYCYKIRAFSGISDGLVSSPVSYMPFLSIKISAKYEDGAAFIEWGDLGCSSYTLYKKAGKNEWKTIYSTSNVFSYLDENIKTGEKYSYSLVAEKNGKRSSFDTKGVSVTVLGDTVIKSVKNSVDNSIQIVWNRVEGATSYRVFRKVSGGEYACVGTTAKTSFYDKTAKKNNLKYSYYVQAVAANSYGSDGIEFLSFLFMEAPVINNVKVNSNGTNVISWNSVKGATAYKILRKVPGGSWSAVSTTESLRYTDKKAQKGEKYYYTVCALNGSVSGAYSSGRGVNCLDAPGNVSTERTKTGVKVSWECVDGADGYYVYRKLSDGEWSKIAKVKTLSYTDKTSLESGKKYVYSVKAYSSDGAGLLNTFGAEIRY